MAEQPQKEPSMEEILASIRRIISEDGDTTPSAHEAGDSSAQPAAEAEAVYDLTQEVDAEGNPVTPTEALAEQSTEQAKEASAGEPAPTSKQAEIDAIEFDAVPSARSGPTSAEDDASLVGTDAEAAAAASFATLTEKMAPPRVAPDTPEVSAGGRTVEQLAADLLRPMLKEWLDENLPGLVERLVKREIERIARSRRR